MSLNYQAPVLPIGRLSFNTEWSYLIKTYQIRTPAGSAPTRVDRMNVGGTTRWRGIGTVTWRKAAWTGTLSGYYIGAFADTGATISAAQYAALGGPSYIAKTFDSGSFVYRYIVHDVVTFNGALSYRFQRDAARLLRGTSLRLGVINLTDKEPPLAQGAFGYSSSVHGPLFAGRTWTFEVTRQF